MKIKLFEDLLSGNTLYYPGCLGKFVAKDIVSQYKKILVDEGIDFIMLKDKELCCGSPVKNAGADNSFKKMAEKNLGMFKKHGVKRIITNCPACATMFKQDYQKILGEKWNIKVKHIIEIIDKATKNLKLVENNRTAVYHDPCHLSRTLGIYERPREIIQKAGFKIVEMELAKNKSFCCGGGGGVRSNNPTLSGSIGQDRIRQAESTKADVLITSCPMCYMQLKENSENIDVIELSELFVF